MSNIAGHFEIVSLRQFTKDWTDKFPPNQTDIPFNEILDEIESIYDNLKLPKRATKGSAAYDLYSPIDMTLEPGSEIFFPTGIRCEMEPGWCLLIIPRSGQGTKYKLRLANTCGLIDSDYQYADNTGHIMIKLCNEGDKTLDITAGQACAQMIFLPYGVTEDDDVTEERDGGFGSTDEQNR